SVFFFFQAEDGIRDFHVTGVQTCALPISSVPGLTDIRSDAESGEREVRVTIDRERAAGVGLSTRAIADAIAIAMRGENLREFRRSEERRVGKACRYRWAHEQCKTDRQCNS